MLYLVYEYPYFFGVVVPTSFMLLALWAVFGQRKHEQQMREFEKRSRARRYRQLKEAK